METVSSAPLYVLYYCYFFRSYCSTFLITVSYILFWTCFLLPLPVDQSMPSCHSIGVIWLTAFTSLVSPSRNLVNLPAVQVWSLLWNWNCWDFDDNTDSDEELLLVEERGKSILWWNLLPWILCKQQCGFRILLGLSEYSCGKLEEDWPHCESFAMDRMSTNSITAHWPNRASINAAIVFVVSFDETSIATFTCQ